MLDRIIDTDRPAPTIVLNGQVDGRMWEATLLINDLEQLAQVAARQPGRTANAGPVRVQILANANGAQ